MQRPSPSTPVSRTWRSLFKALPLLASLLLAALFTVPYARAAANRTVTTLSDTMDPNDGLLSLREAILITNGTLQLSALSPQDQALVLGTPNGSAGTAGGAPSLSIFAAAFSVSSSR